MKLADVLGLNRRELELINPLNPRAQILKIAANKIAAKALLVEHGLPVPALYGVIAHAGDYARFRWQDLPLDFALKPSGGGRGCGILVTNGYRDGAWRSHGGAPITLDALRYHVLAILHGDFSREGGCDHAAFFEQKLRTARDLTGETAQGLPDLRVIVREGVAVMAMMRIPTSKSDGKANLHQGAIGVGIDLPTGVTKRGVWGSEIIRDHPDTEHSIVGLKIPRWDELLHMAARCHELSELGYIGVDFVLDRDHGPMILELNARPGLSIQMANANGLQPRLEKVEALAREGRLSKDPAERVAFAKANFPTTG